MDRMTIDDVRIDKDTIRRTIIDAEKVKECAMEFYWRLKAIEDVIADEERKRYDLDRLRELVEADREGRVKIHPKAENNTCGACGHFHRIAGLRCGTCDVQSKYKDRYGREEERRGTFTPSQSRKACKKYIQKGEQNERSV